MKLKLKKLTQFCGDKASFYTISRDGHTSFGQFLDENIKSYEAELLDILGRLKNMGTKNAATENFFKPDESSNPKDEKVVAFYDKPGARLRLYCIKLSDRIIVLGSGGPKPKSVIKWQDSQKLKKEAEFVMQVSELIATKIKNGDLTISDDGLSFTGKLELN